MGVVMFFRYDLLLTVDDAGMVSVLDKNIKLVILFNPWCKGTCMKLNPMHLLLRK